MVRPLDSIHRREDSRDHPQSGQNRFHCPPILPVWQGDPTLASAELERQWRVVANPDQPTGIRGILRFAVEAAGIGWKPERVTEIGRAHV